MNKLQARASLAKYYGVSPDAPEIDKEMNQDKKKNQANGSEDKQVSLSSVGSLSD